jgi:dTDP-4-dehydrorhamnose 3,5-epimerase
VSSLVDTRPMAVLDAYTFTPDQHGDERGTFAEWYRTEWLEDVVGHRLEIRQANVSVSALGVLRGIHFAAVPPGQAKYVTCVSGAVLDVVLDVRVGSPTFGRWDAARLDAVDRRTVYLAEGLGHAFVALTDRSTVGYLCSEAYNPTREFGVNPFDPALGIRWPTGLRVVLSDKDQAAPGLADAKEAGLLPSYSACRDHYETLRNASKARLSD